MGRSDPSEPSRPDEQMIADWEDMGVRVADAVREQAALAEREESFAVWRCNWKTMTAFLMLETQWRAAATMTRLHWIGLDYSAAAALFAGKSRKKFHRLIDDLQVMEFEALPILNADPEGTS
ncbi:MAG: DUF1799 domain-containing protein [Pseudomonadota bacterium]